MVRLITPIDKDQDLEAADARLADFGSSLAALLPSYVPH